MTFDVSLRRQTSVGMAHNVTVENVPGRNGALAALNAMQTMAQREPAIWSGADLNNTVWSSIERRG